MPKFLEKKLKKQYGAKSDVPYKIMNAAGYMHGSKETAKGAAAQAKHESDVAKDDPVTARKKRQRKAAEKVVYGK